MEAMPAEAAPLRIAIPILLAASAALAGDVVVQKRYLHLPVARAGELATVHLLDGGNVALYFRMPLATAKGDALYWTSIDWGFLKAKTLEARVLPPHEAIDIGALYEQSDEFRKPPGLYQEPYRPQFHFTAMTGWINDPNGLVYFDGEWRLFYQHDPWSTRGANKSWGRAASRDLIHWTDYADALLPDRLGAIYSGSAVIDHGNTSGFQEGALPPMVVFYTSAGYQSPENLPFTQSLAYSNDRGRTLVKYAGNPVIGHIEDRNRDPKVFWHQPSGKWVMALYLARGKFQLLDSKNLREWQKMSDVEFPDGHECPELFELPVRGGLGETRWLMWEAGGRHRIGRFDGRRFRPETGVLPSEWAQNSYAAQTWNDAPDGRRVLISWMRSRAAEGIYPGMPFDQQMSFPRELSLRPTEEGLRLFQWPVREIEKLYAKRHDFSGRKAAPGANLLSGIRGELFDLEGRLELGAARSVTLDVRGVPIVYGADGKLSCAGNSVVVGSAGSPLELRVVIDRTSMEIFAAGGRYVMSVCFRPSRSGPPLILTTEGGAGVARLLDVRELKPALPRPGV
jgi:fructan beta-fructosidase